MGKIDLALRTGTCRKFIFCLFTAFILSLLNSRVVPAVEDLVQMLEPAEHSEVIARKPIIRVSLAAEPDRAALLVLLDDVDITQTIHLTPGGFAYKPVQALGAGDHLLQVIGRTLDGREFDRKFRFRSRHTKSIDEISSNNQLDAVLESVNHKRDYQNLPNFKADANLSSESFLKAKGWDVSLKGNLRYLDQTKPVIDPERKGISLIDYLLTLGYTKDRFSVRTELGDTVITGTENTLRGLARRGGKAAIKYGGLSLGGFVVRGKETYRFDGNLGLSIDNSDHIMGLTAESGMFVNKILLKGVYITGGRKDDFFGTFDEDGGQKGNVYGVQLKTDFLDRALRTDMEYDFARFDRDTSDDLPTQGDRAYRVRLGGDLKRFSYQATYRYFGRDYEVMGAPGLEKDKEGILLEAGANFTQHTFKASYDQHHDNVEEDSAYPIFYTNVGKLEYSFLRFPSLPVTVGFERAVVESRDEPEFTLPFETHTDRFFSTIAFNKDRFNLGISGSHSFQDDRSEENGDTVNNNFSFSPSYSWDHFSIGASYSYNLTDYLAGQEDLETHTGSLDLRGDLVGRNITYELSGTYNRSRSENRTTDQESISSDGRVAYLLGKDLWGNLNPSVGLKASYRKNWDWACGREEEAHSILFIFSTSIPFLF